VVAVTETLLDAFAMPEKKKARKNAADTLRSAVKYFVLIGYDFQVLKILAAFLILTKQYFPVHAEDAKKMQRKEPQRITNYL
jgi:hypothetical protein